MRLGRLGIVSIFNSTTLFRNYPYPKSTLTMSSDLHNARPRQETEQTVGKKEEETKKYPDPWMIEIVPGLFLGNVQASVCPEMLRKNHINAMISLYESLSGWARAMSLAGKPDDLHIFIRSEDSPTLDLLVYMSDICDFVDQIAPPALRLSSSLQFSSDQTPTDSILVHCRAGRSRSPAVIIAYLMRKYRITYEDALKFVLKRRKVKLSANLVRQLRIWEKVGYNVWKDNEKTIPKALYRAYLDDRAVQMDGTQDHNAIANARNALTALYPIGPKFEPPYCCQLDRNCTCKDPALPSASKSEE